MKKVILTGTGGFLGSVFYLTKDFEPVEVLAVASKSTLPDSCLTAPGTLDHFERLDALDADPTVIKYVKAYVEGETLPPEARSELRQITLRVLGAVDGARDLEPAMLRVQDAVRIVSDEGEDLKLPGLNSADFQGNVLVDGRW